MSIRLSRTLTKEEMLTLANLSCADIWVVLSAHRRDTICFLSARGFPEGPLFCLVGVYLGVGVNAAWGISVLPSICNEKID